MLGTFSKAIFHAATSNVCSNRSACHPLGSCRLGNCTFWKCHLGNCHFGSVLGKTPQTKLLNPSKLTLVDKICIYVLV